MNKPWKLVLVLFGIFIAGGITGAVVTLRFGRDWVARRPSPNQWEPNHMKRLADRLALTADQQEQLRPIIHRNMEELSRLRNESMVATKSVFEHMEQEVSEKLTPEQRIKYEQLNKEMRERARKVMPDRNNHPPSSAGPPPGDRPSPPPDKPAGGV